MTIKRKSGGQIGNSNAKKEKIWEEALRMELKMFEDKTAGIERKTVLRHIARVIIKQALKGDPQAWKEIGDRIDGKPKQSIQTESTVNITYTEEDKQIMERYLPNFKQEARH